jgi:malonate-semialdehyde dehydrogenase (acetylating) / methylmalonate-semialdehyde dehydrogenase
MDFIIPHHIKGESYVVPDRTLEIKNPATGRCIAKIYCANHSVVNQAVAVAKEAQKEWARTPAIKKAKILRKFAQMIEENIPKLAQMVTLEHGKTLSDAEASIQRGLEILHYHFNIQQQLQGHYSHQVSQNIHAHTLYQALGVCVGVSPFNFPAMVPLWMMIPAISCGNSFILKPSEKVPSASLQLIQWLEDCGLPKGVVQCLQGDRQTVQLLLEHPDIAAFTAVGSTKTARHIYTEATARGKRAHTFGGAKNHAVVMPDADFEHAAENIVNAAFGSAGQRCMAISAVICVGAETSAKLIEKLIPKIQKIQIGPGDALHTDMGPVISLEQKNHLLTCLEQGQKEGAKLIVDGRNAPIPSEGFFIGPSLFTQVSPHMDIYQNELFGPILVMLSAHDLSHAIEIINNHRYGNGSVIFTQIGAQAQQFADEVNAGMIGINVPVPVPIVSHPFGGWKDSSFGDRPMHALESIHFYTKQKTVTSTWPNQDGLTSSFSMPVH